MKRKLLLFMLAICLFIGQIHVCQPVSAETYLKEKDFLNLLLEKMEWNDMGDSVDTYELALAKKIITKSDKAQFNKALTRQRAALYLSRADIAANGNTYDKTLYKKIVSGGRISDLKAVSSSCRTSVVKMYEKGIMIGDSNGAYSQNRKFSPDTKVTLSLAKNCLIRLKTVSKRKQISPDGQLLRTTNLPHNAKSYPYILQSFPNSFYQAKFEYQITKYNYTPVRLIDYASPVDIGKMVFAYNGTRMQTVLDNHLDDWCKTVKKNIQTRFNVNYKTVNASWVNKLRSTYYVFDGDAVANSRQTEDIKDYVKRMKANKVVIKTEKVVVERSTVYSSGTIYIRVYVKFKVKECNSLSNLNNVIYNDGISIKNLKKNTWKECYFDIGVGTCNGYSLGEDYAILDNTIINIK